MIIAKGIFWFSFIVLSINILGVLLFLFTNIVSEETMKKNSIYSFLFWFGIALCSAQYIWG